MPPTTSPRIDWLKYKPLDSTLTMGRKKGFKGSSTMISCRSGWLGSGTPAMAEMRGDQAPAALTTRSHSIVPRFVTTRVMALPRVSSCVTSVKSATVTPASRAART